MRASTIVAVPAQLEVARLQLELERIDRAIDAARAGGGAGAAPLGRERNLLKSQLDKSLLRALDETAVSPR